MEVDIMDKKKNNMRWGKGKFVHEDGSYYDGMWKENKMHGKGVSIIIDFNL